MTGASTESLALERALLSHLAREFTHRIPHSQRVKHGKIWTDAFDGVQAVDLLLALIADAKYPRTADRQVALRVGKSLQAQRLFVDVVDPQRALDDTAARIYRLCALKGRGPRGVYTALTDCYAPRCDSVHPCYNPGCPRWKGRRWEGSSRDGVERPVDERVQDDFASMFAPLDSEPAGLPLTTSETEAKRLAAINEVVLTEANFNQAMAHVVQEWIVPLRDSPSIPPQRRAHFITEVFYNLPEIIRFSTAVQSALFDASVLPDACIGAALLPFVRAFDLFLAYTNHHFFSRKILEEERKKNPAFAACLIDLERRQSSRKLDLSTYLGMPATRLSLYPLLLDAILQNTPEGHPDRLPLTKCVDAIRGLTAQVKIETQQHVDLFQLSRDLVFPSSEQFNDLQLSDPNRKLLFKSALSSRQAYDLPDMSVFLLDHALVITKPEGARDWLNVHRKPIPLELLQVSVDTPPQQRTASFLKRRSSQLFLRSVAAFASGTASSTSVPSSPLHSQMTLSPPGSGNAGYPVTFTHAGGNNFQVTLWAETARLQKKWTDEIRMQQDVLSNRVRVFECATMEGGNAHAGRTPFLINCVAAFDKGRGLVLGAADGVYVTGLGVGQAQGHGMEYRKMASAKDVTQVEVVNVQPLPVLVYIADGQISSIPLEDSHASSSVRRQPPGYGRILAARRSDFFSVGMQGGEMLLFAVRNAAVSGTVYMYKWMKAHASHDKRHGWTCTQSFYLPAPIKNLHVLKTIVIVVTEQMFEVINPMTLEANSMLDPADPCAVDTRNLHAMAVYRVHDEFFMCYRELGFHVSRQGWRSRPELVIKWHGRPTAFAIYFPYILAFDPTFVEVRELNSGILVQIVPYENNAGLRCVRAPSTGPHDDVAPPYEPHVPPPTYDAPSAPPSAGLMTASGADPIILVLEDRIMTLRDLRTLHLL